MKTMWKRIGLLFLAAALVLSLAGCGEIKVEDDPEIRRGVEAFLDALTAKDADGAYAAVYSGIGQGDFNAAFAQMVPCVEGMEDYTLELMHYNYSNRNGVETIQTTYRMTAGEKCVIVTASRIEGYEGLTGIHVVPEEQTTLRHTGTLGHMAGADAFQWVMLVLGILVWGFVIWMIVDCCRRKITRKALWLVLIILGTLVLTLTLSSGSVNFRFNFGLYLQLSALIRYGDGSSQLALVVPVGAIIYCAMRRRLVKQDPPVPQSEIPETVTE